MKKLLYGLCILLLTACSSSSFSGLRTSGSSSSPQRQSSTMVVDNTVTLSGVTMVGDTIYAIAGSTIGLNPVNVKSVSGDEASFHNVMYFVDSNMVGDRRTNSTPSFSTSKLAPGKHMLSAAVTVKKSDASLAGLAVNLPIVIVPNAQSLPKNAPPIGTYTRTVRVKK